MTILRKKKICKECHTLDYLFSKGRCKKCAVGEYKSIKKITPKTQKIKKETSKIREEYFSYHIDRCKKSEESGVLIYEPSRSNICHILPKRIYKSVQAHLNNYVYLTLDEHTRLDRFLDEMNLEAVQKEFPKIYPILKERFNSLIPYVTETHGKLFNLLKDA
jgi:hypothetical protein